jgi:hypothetical protein
MFARKLTVTRSFAERNERLLTHRKKAKEAEYKSTHTCWKDTCRTRGTSRLETLHACP